METISPTNETTTQVSVTVEEETLGVNNMHAALFIMFAEYLGYVSTLNEEAEKWCNGKVPADHVRKILIVEAKCILRQMLKDYGQDAIRTNYENFYPLVLEEWDEKLKKLVEPI